MSKTMKKVSALLLALLMIFSFMPMTQESAYAAAKKPGKVKNLKVSAVYSKDGKSVSLKITWKKAKNAKKYSVSIKDNGTKLTATKSVKKCKLTVKAHFGTSYKISVKAINGKKKGKAVSKSVKTEADPTKVDKTEYDKAEQNLADKTKEYDALKKSDDATKAELEQAKKNLDKAAEQYDALDKAAREELLTSYSLQHADWSNEVKDALNSMIKNPSNSSGKYVVFDFDNTCSIFDVEEQLAVYQLQTMSFASTVTPQTLPGILSTELKKAYFTNPAKASKDYCENPNATYQDWIDDINAAFTKLCASDFATDGHFTPAGLTEEQQVEIQKTDDWKEFATKMRAMYDCVFDSESAAVAYPWVLYWFTGMTHAEVYDLAYRSHSLYKNKPSTYETWYTPDSTAGSNSKIGAIGGLNDDDVFEPTGFTWSSGTAVSENIVELMAALSNNGIDVWVCSASATDPIRAAIDVFGLHSVVKGMMAMTNVYEDGKFVNEYDYERGYAWLPQGDKPGEDKWEEAVTLGATKAQTQGKGKVTAVQNVCGTLYNNGPIAGFMDSTGDYNFCTEFSDLQVVCCFNRASRKVTDGGGVIAELAVYQADTLYADKADKYAAAQAEGNTLYVLQGREENGFRGLRPERKTLRLGKSSPALFANADNQKELDYMIAEHMTTEAVVNEFARKKAKGASTSLIPSIKYGFLKKYSGYHTQGAAPQAPVSQLAHEDWNKEVKDALNDMIANNDDPTAYAVFDFDNTCSIYDVEEQLAVYQLQTMAFASTVDVAELKDILKTGIAQNKEDFPQGLDTPISDEDVLGEGRTATYNDFIEDIAAAYQKLIDKGYSPKPEGVEFNKYAEDADWLEFATKMRAMYDFVFDAESADVAYPWVLYWFTGMTHAEVYNLAKASHTYYSNEDTKYVTWTTEGAGSRVGNLSFTWSCGTQVSDNIVELMKTLDENGIDVWVCSASATDPIRAAIDVWGLHNYVTGMMAMTNVYKNGVYDNEYDYENGVACIPTASLDPQEADWTYDDKPTKAQTQGKGKVTAIQNVCYPKYQDHGPIAGFMDSTGDFNFCTEFDTLEVVTCFNRASRKVTDGGGLVAEVAVYEADTLGYDYTKAYHAGDTLYVLQGRDETKKRKLCNITDKDGYNLGRATIRVTSSTVDPAVGNDPKVFANDDNKTQLQYMIDNNMSVEDAFNKFAMKTAAGPSEDNPFSFKFGFLKEYDHYHSQA